MDCELACDYCSCFGVQMADYFRSNARGKALCVMREEAFLKYAKVGAFKHCEETGGWERQEDVINELLDGERGLLAQAASWDMPSEPAVKPLCGSESLAAL
jgi:hypothetical protein